MPINPAILDLSETEINDMTRHAYLYLRHMLFFFPMELNFEPPFFKEADELKFLEPEPIRAYLLSQIPSLDSPTLRTISRPYFETNRQHPLFGHIRATLSMDRFFDVQKEQPVSCYYWALELATIELEDKENPIITLFRDIKYRRTQFGGLGCIFWSDKPFLTLTETRLEASQIIS